MFPIVVREGGSADWWKLSKGVSQLFCYVECMSMVVKWWC